MTVLGLGYASVKFCNSAVNSNSCALQLERKEDMTGKCNLLDSWLFSILQSTGTRP